MEQLVKYTQNVNWLRSVGYLPIGSGGVWQKGLTKIKVDFVDGQMIINLIDEQEL